MVPAIFDDGEIEAEPIKKKKAFSDVGDLETILRERWTAAKFVKHQLRIVCDNSCDDELPEDFHTPESLIVPHEQFIKIVHKALGCIPVPDQQAILKRAVFIVISKKHIYIRKPSEQEIDVRRMRWSRSDILIPECKPRFSNYRKDGPPPIKKEKHDQKEASFLLASAAWSKTLQNSSTVVDLATPSPPKRSATRDSLEEVLSQEINRLQEQEAFDKPEEEDIPNPDHLEGLGDDMDVDIGLRFIRLYLCS